MLVNHFELHMLPEGFTGTITVRPSSAAEARAAAEAGGCWVDGEIDAAIMNLALGVEPLVNPGGVMPDVRPGDEIVVAHRHRSGRWRFTLVDIGHPTEWRT